uniref:DNA-directed RNA polymerase n=1 Tax=Volvulina compacta TaxID=51721 RepID=A0A6C0RW00_9CHLO|nr:RNA polymerase alpha subunit [Volvulina compacta]
MNIKNIMTKIKTTDFFIACKQSRIENNTSFYGCFYVGPFDDNISQTLANDLRRTLLSELTGLAITSIEIEGVVHKFSNLPGMKESVLDLICNLQNIVFKKQEINTKILGNTKKTYTGFLNVHGPRVIKAIDLRLPAFIQCVDPNQYIATLAEDGFLNMKFNINEGRGTVKQKPYNLDVNTLKKRNILQQNFKIAANKQENDKTVLKGKLQRKTNSMPVGTVEDGYCVDKASIRPPYSGRMANTIPLDAIFMPITKINCIVEENLLYSEFSTDLQNTNDSAKYNNNLLPQNINMAAKVKKLNSFVNLQKKQLSNVKLIPWQSNALYFNIITQNPTQPQENFFLACKPTTMLIPFNTSIKKPFIFAPKISMTQTVKSEILHFPPKVNKTASTPLLAEASRAKPKKILSQALNKKLIWLPTNKKIQNNMFLEYSKNLKLKPLRKKAHLIIEIWTNGSIHPRQALYEAFSILSNIFLKLQTVKTFSPFKSNYNLKQPQENNLLAARAATIALLAPRSNISEASRAKHTKKDKNNKINRKKWLSEHPGLASLKAPIGILPISLRAYTTLKKTGIFSINDLIKYSKKDLLKIKNLGVKSLFEIEASLSSLGLTLS